MPEISAVQATRLAIVRSRPLEMHERSAIGRYDRTEVLSFLPIFGSRATSASLETEKRVLGAEHPGMLTRMGNLAFTWKKQGRVAEAIELMKKCVQLQTQILGAGHPDTLSSSEDLIEWETENLMVD